METTGKDFPRRNRLIAGLAQATLVVEAAKRSGSLISARLANEAGRTVYAIPGSPLDPRSEGANWLIKQGATLVTEPKEIIDELSQSSLPLEDNGFIEDESEAYDIPIVSSDEIKEKIIAALGPSPVEVDDIIRFSKATSGQVQLVLIELALAGRIERHGGNRVSINLKTLTFGIRFKRIEVLRCRCFHISHFYQISCHWFINFARELF